MAWGKKPWQGGTRKKKLKHYYSRDENDYDRDAFDFTSQYRSRKEANSTIKGFLSMLFFIAALMGTMWCLILFYHWVGVTF